MVYCHSLLSEELHLTNSHLQEVLPELIEGAAIRQVKLTL